MKYFFWMAICLWFSPHFLAAQHTLSGNITDPSGHPLQGASIILEGTNLGTAADEEGYFIIKELVNKTYQLKLSYVGYQDQVKNVEVNGLTSLDFIMEPLYYELEGVEVLGTWASASTPVTFTEINKEALAKADQGQDIPYLVRWTPSVVATSDAGTGVGYTGLRIRGADPTQTNVTINGVPLNDSESQGVFWVDLPDLAASTDNIQIQRGVGTSTNGAGAFGATLNIRTLGMQENAYLEFDNTYGSFNTHKHSLQFGTGKMKNKLAFDARLSIIQSDGYVDRAKADMKGMFLSGAYYGNKTILRGMALIGKERTYQSWYGTPQGRIENDVEEMQRHASYEGYSDGQLQNLLNAGRSYNFYLYEDEVDDYKQDHYQLHITHQFNPNLSFGGALHYTYGRGFFEQYKSDEELAFYQISPEMIGGEERETGDVVRRRWLDNDFYGLTYNLQYQKEQLEFTVGGAANQYDGDHFGQAIKVITDRTINIAAPPNYYFSQGDKRDFNVFTKANYSINNKISLFGDLQLRNIDYNSIGNDNDLQNIDFAVNYTFFNPKFGVNYTLSDQHAFYASFAKGQKEPLRSDFTDAPGGNLSDAESLVDFELGYKFSTDKTKFQVNIYNMDYNNQLVQTGELNDVGAVLRTNVKQSFRRGVEVQWELKPNNKFNWQANLTLSQNRIKDFNQVVYDYTNGFDVIINKFEETNISFSPSVIGASELSYSLMKDFNVSLRSKYVGKQYLDNTGSDEKSLDDYFVNDLIASYKFNIEGIRSLGLRFSVHNIFNNLYSSNGYTYTYIFGETVTENLYYPQAGTHFMVGLRLKL